MSSNNRLQRLVLVLCAMLVPPAIFSYEVCEEFRKQVSVDGGVTWFEADDAASAPTQTVGGAVVYRFIVKNCETNKKCFHTFINDPTLDLNNVDVPDGVDETIDPGEEIIITKDDTGFENLDQPNRCDTPGLKYNKATETTFVQSGQGSVEEHFMNKAYVDCVEPQLASLGDRVWEDLNADGIQDNGEPGIGNVPVELLTPGPDGNCDTMDDISSGMLAMTNFTGFYLFEDLMPGDYCVKFTKPVDEFCDTDGFNLGSPQFTVQDQGGDDTVDSDANPDTGVTGNIPLMAGDNDLSNDAGIFCPAKLGDRVFLDDGDGIQEAGEPGIAGVTVNLFACGPDGIAGTGDDIDPMQSRTTDVNGLYMFGGEPGVYDLAPGNYYVLFERPNGLEFTLPGQGGDDATDSDCLTPSGRTACTGPLGSRGINLNRDCGLVAPPPTCDLTLNKTCLIPPPSPPAGKCDGKLQQFTVIWTGDTINVSGPSNDAPGGVVNNGQAVTFSGPFSSNDVFVNITGSIGGFSKFHVSCSDNDFNTPDDCGNVAGDGKGDANAINAWQLEGWVDKNGDVLSCSAGGGPGNGFPSLDVCQASPQDADCATLGKPKSLTLRYTGGTCPGANSQGGKAKCDDIGPLSDTIQVIITGKDASKFMFLPDAIVTRDTADDSFTLSRSDGTDFKAGTKLELKDNMGTLLQKLEIHTSCSATLAVGDEFGGLTLTGFNGNSGGFEVVYGYSVTNSGDPLTGVNLTDN
ncbi:MAG: hypothetical protein O7G83_20335, partial [Proteobacteria bacterium]|nr:hypothetical protein [Pseudomonadota bacterium]